MKNRVLLITLLSFFNLSYGGNLDGAPKSGEGDNGFGSIVSAIGVNRSENTISGYHHLYNLDMPDRSFHVDCILVFSGRLSDASTFDIRIKNAAALRSKAVSGKLIFDGIHVYRQSGKSEQLYKLVLSENLPSCSRDIDLSESDIQFSINRYGNWEKVSAIQSSKAYFHYEPNESMPQKSYLVAKDIIHIYEQKPGWYYVKFQGKKRETAGWIKMSETVELDQH